MRGTLHHMPNTQRQAIFLALPKASLRRRDTPRSRLGVAFELCEHYSNADMISTRRIGDTMWRHSPPLRSWYPQTRPYTNGRIGYAGGAALCATSGQLGTAH